ncbi:MAG: acyltransferase [Terracidiphilus sp.]|jgi:peptidoglycan/LPS O-acetylase OafA/YrhL
MDKTKSDTNLQSLDGLRGLMALWVLCGHVCHYAGMTFVPILRSPDYAVDGFMLLSGFLMTYHYELRATKEPWTSWRTWVSFYIRRYFRISPLYYLLLVPAYLFHSYYSRWAESGLRLVFQPTFYRSPAPFDLSHVLMHVSLLFGLSPRYHASLILPDWSLSLEMQFYLAFPFLMLFVMRFGWLACAALASAIYAVSNSSVLGYAKGFAQPSPLCLSILWFAIGMIWAGSYVEGRGNHRLWVLLGCLLASISGDFHDILVVAVFAWVLFADGWIAMGPSATMVRRLLSGRISKFMADSSYSVYLTHLLILIPVAYLIATHFRLPPVLRWSIAMVITAVSAYSLAAALHRIETFGINIGKTLAYKLSQPVERHIPFERQRNVFAD